MLKNKIVREEYRVYTKKKNWNQNEILLLIYVVIQFARLDLNITIKEFVILYIIFLFKRGWAIF